MNDPSELAGLLDVSPMYASIPIEHEKQIREEVRMRVYKEEDREKEKREKREKEFREIKDREKKNQITRNRI